MTANTTDYQHLNYASTDGLNLYARDYPRPESPNASDTTVICIPGLTRNSADYSELAPILATRYRVLCMDLRGRGRSDYDPNPENYQPGCYVMDLATLIADQQLSQVILVGTSLGGLVSMIYAALHPAHIAAIVLNDIGPEIHPEGLKRIQSYVGKCEPVDCWDAAILQTRAINERELPGMSDSEWLAMARNLYREDDNGLPQLDYDPAIAGKPPANSDAPIPDLWAQFAMIQDIRTLLIRGGFSDIITESCVSRMKEMMPTLNYREIPNRGHAPLLNEADSVSAICQFLEV